MRSRAQSETLGFALVFAIMIASVALAYTAGLGGLTDVRDVEQVNNAERAFEVLADNMDDITQRNAPSRATEIKLASASLTVAEPIRVAVNVTGEYNATYDVRPIVYDADTGTEIVYAQGAILRQRGDAGTVRRESNLLLNRSRTVIPIVQVRLGGTGSVGGSTTALIRTDHSQTLVPYADADPATSDTVWYNITSPRAGTWRDYLEDRGDVDSCIRSGDTVSCELTSDRIHLVVVQIDVALA